MIQTERILTNPTIAIDHAGKGDLLVLLHGIGGNRTNWTRQVEVFSEEFHTVAWDARGYGNSDDYDGPLDFEDFSHDLLELIDYFGADTAHVCGLSMGGRIAQDFYRLYPNRVATLVLIATYTSWSEGMSEAELKKFTDLRLKPLKEDGEEPKDIAPRVAKTLLGPDASDVHYRQLVQSMENLHKDSYIKTIESSITHDNKRWDLQAFNIPSLLVYGERDQLCPPAMGRAMADRIPGSIFVEIPRAGHLINIEQAEHFEKVVLEFLMNQKITRGQNSLP